MEEWRSVVGFPDYAVSSAGEIKRVAPDYRGKVGCILKPTRSGSYVGLTLYRDREPHYMHVHRIVCTAFHGIPVRSKNHAAHKDGDGTNNHRDNLRWATPSENEADKVAHGRSRLGKPTQTRPERLARGPTHGRYTMPERTARGERTATSKLTVDKVVKIRKDSRSRKQIAADYGITVTMVGYIVRGISWAHVPMQAENQS